MVMPNKKVWDANLTQQLIADAVFSGKYTDILCGGSIRSGKTVGCLKILYAMCKIFPGSRWGVVRESSPVLKRTTIPSFWQTCPYPFFHPERFNKVELTATASNGSQILFIPESINDDPELLRFGGLEVNGFVLEQAEEVQPKTYYKCKERAGSWNMDPMPDPLVLLNCNPHQGYLKQEFYTPGMNGKLLAPDLFIPALLQHNKQHLSEKYLINLETLKTKSPGLYRRMILGSWDAEDAVDQLISWDVIYACDKEYVPPVRKAVKSLGVDVARFGADGSAWTFLEDFNLEECFKIDRTDMVDVAEKTERMIIEKQIPHDRVFIDTVGLGGGAFDILKKKGYGVQEFIAGASPVEQFAEGGFSFKNMKTQAAWNMKLGFESGKAGKLDKDEELKQDIGANAYEVVGDKKINLLSKDEIKKRIHRSPDKGDSYTMAYWGQIYDQITPAPDFFMM